MVRTFLIFCIAFILGIFFQGTLLHSVLPDVVAPDLLLVLAVFLGLRARTPLGALGAFLIGLGGDFATAKFLGPSAAGSVVAFGTTVFFANHFFSEKWFTVAITSLLASFAKNLTAALVLRVFTEVNLFSVESLGTLIIEAILTAIAAPIVVRLLHPRFSHSGGYSSAKARLRRA